MKEEIYFDDEERTTKGREATLSPNTRTHMLIHIYQEGTRERKRRENKDQKRINQECIIQKCVHEVKRRTNRKREPYMKVS